ncbi:hypothetical protein ACFGOO_09815 [Treponema vincentii]|uniref:hypothetical protein n=1 Tax=Treponema vincentii TaxID=69710 RepID=UPI0035F571D8
MLITNFAGGEVSKNLYGRIDLPLYQKSVSRLENFSILPQGGITRRSGTERVGKLKGRARLIPFIVNTNLSFLFEFGAEYIRIWKNGELLTHSGYPIEFLPTADLPLYKSAELEAVQYVQTFDRMYLTHRHYRPYVITWQGGESFTLGTLNITGNAHQVPFQSPDEYPACVALFSSRLFLASTTKQPQRIWASKVFDYENFTYSDTVVSSSTQLKKADLRVFSAKATKGSATLTAVTKDFTGITNITDYYISGHKGVPKGTKVASVTSDTMTLTNAVTEDKEDMVLSIHLWKNPESPASEDYKNIEKINNVTSPAHAFYLELASDKNDAIKWLACAKDLIVGTECSEWVIPEGVNAQQVQVQLQSRYGVSDTQAALIGRTVLYIGQGGHTVRDYSFDFQERTYKSIDVTQAANHLLTESAAVDFDYTNTASPRIFVNREDGTVCVLLYDKDIGCAAWSRITLKNGKVTNIATIPGEGGYDEIYLSVEREGVYYLECLTEEKAGGEAVYLDSYCAYTSETDESQYRTASVYVRENRELFPLEALPEKYKDFSKEMYIGYPYESIVESLPVINSSENNKKRIVSLSIRFLDSYLPLVSQTDTPEQTIYKEEPFTGVEKVPVQGGFERDVFFKVRIEKCERCTILAVNAELA